MWIHKITLLSILLIANMAVGVCSAETGQAMWKQSFQLHGFITQGFIKTDENNYFGNSKDGSAELTEIGVNGSTRITNSLLASAQVLARRAGESYDGSPELDYALVDYSIHNSESSRYGIRLGRFKNPLGLYNDTRDVAFTRPGIFLPQSIYYDNLRNALLSNDGALFYGEIWSGQDTFDLQLGVGKTPVDGNIEYALIGEDVPGNLTDDDVTFVGRVLYSTDSLQAGISYAKARLKLENSIPVIGDGRFEIDIWILSLQYLYENWTFTTEWAKQPLEWQEFSAFFPAGSNGSYEPGGYFLQASYRYKPEIELTIRYEEGYSNRDDKDGTQREAILASLPVPVISPAHNYYTNDITVGIRYDVTQNFMLRLEAHKIEGTSILSRRENNTESSIKNWDMFSLLLSYRF